MPASDDTHNPPAMVPDRRELVRLHLGLVIAGVLCPAAFGVELWRALAGNDLSWVYVVEWPLFLAIAVWMWKSMVDSARGRTRIRPTRAEPIAEDDADLVAWRHYVAGLEDQLDAGSPAP
jgi:hypothetical protein